MQPAAASGQGPHRCGRAWADVHRVKGQQLACPECRGQVFARLSPHRARHFYHQERPPEGELAHEPPNTTC
ncbi:hypothetical protein ACN6LA_007056 [Streptomyces sp. SAS_269]|uniref:hypothetical protein n=1 Tax=Streptomyces sp. SAS_269 TaxID=3412749 RepID=UPI00403D06B0